MKKSKGVAVLLALLLALAGLAYYASIILSSTGTGEDKNIKLGLDLAGGVSITYQVVSDNPTAEQMSDTIYKLQKRVEGYSTEATVYQEGDDRITVEIPGVKDANQILEDLGKPGSLEFKDPEGNVYMTGDDVADAQAATINDQMQNKEFVVELTLNDEGTKKFADVTTANVGKICPIYYDDEAISTPKVNEAITGGKAQISGMSTYQEAEDLASSIRIGSLSLKLEELQSKVVGAQLGNEAISTALKAAAIGLVLIAVFMIAYYWVAGIAATIALAIYSALVVAVIYLFEVTLTLPGIAGIILSIGMAVDANVIIFTRIKEEITAGNTVKVAVKAGFHKAMSAILDGNITTLIAAAVLWIMASGSVKGFAQTLALGIILSMFTALVITRLLLNAFVNLGATNPKLYGTIRERKSVNYVKNAKVCFIISAVIIITGFVFLPINKNNANIGHPLNFSMEFMGGTSMTVEFDQNYTLQEAEEKILPVLTEATGIPDSEIQLQNVQDSTSIVIKTPQMTLDQREAAETALKDNFTVQNFSVENISSTVSGEMQRDAIVSVVIAAVLMLIYIAFRFKDVRFGASAVLALLHDVLFVFTLYAVAHLSVGSTFIACMLTILGYSINATIIIFDRIRENLKVMDEKKVGLATIVNTSITQTFTRSIYTNLTTFVMVLVLYIVGVSAIQEFALALMVGVLGGTYSSICITGPLWYYMKTKFSKKKANK